MTEPSSHDAAHAGGATADPERDAKIDELLLAGLEHYFAGRYQESINVWGRVLFLDRSHARARAYIERARGALAEQQRQSEQLAQEGVDAIRRGDGGAARELLRSAATQGDSPDAALAYLDRLERLAGAVTPASATPGPRRRPSRPAEERVRGGLGPRPVRALPLLIAAVVVGVAIVVGATFDLLKPLVDASWARPASGPAVIVAPEPLPVPRSAELAIARARALAATGHLRDGLVMLDRVPVGDPAYPEAELVRGTIQRQLLAGPSARSAPGGAAE